jgi:hypothetical protein
VIALSTPMLVLALWAAAIVAVTVLAGVVGAIEARRYVRRLSPEARQLLALRQRRVGAGRRQIAR